MIARRTLLAALPLATVAAARGSLTAPGAPLIGSTSGAAQFYDMAGFTGFARAAAMRPDVFLYFAELDDTWHGNAMRPLFDGGATAMATFSYKGPDALGRTVAGAFDRQLSSIARASRAVPMIVRPFHEMNGRFGTSWGAQDAALYRRAWRHVRRLWREAGNDAPFCWSPNIVLTRNNTVPFADYYPGDDACEMMALDGYRTRHHDRPFAELFGPSLASAAALGRRPLYIAEVGYITPGDAKAAWISAMFAYLAGMPHGRRIIGLNWWSRDGSELSTPDAARAFATGVTRWRRAWRG